MIQYNAGKWGVWFAFSLQGSVFNRSVFWGVTASGMATVLHVFIRSRPGLEESLHPGDRAATILTGFMSILGFLVVFRSQQAYARWSEGADLLQGIKGEWFNAFSSLLAFCNQDPQKRHDVVKFQHALGRLVSLLYNCALQQISMAGTDDYELLGVEGFEEASLKFLSSPDVHDKSEIVLQWVQRLIVEANSDSVITIAPPILSRVYNQLGNGIVKVAAAKKISQMPIPFPYAQMVTCMLMFHFLMMPIMCAATLEKPYWAAMLTFVVVFAYWSVNYIAMELEMPFGADANDLPMHSLMADLNQSIIQLMHEKAVSVPAFAFDVAVHTPLVPESLSFQAQLHSSIQRGNTRQRAKEQLCQGGSPGSPGGVEFTGKLADCHSVPSSDAGLLKEDSPPRKDSRKECFKDDGSPSKTLLSAKNADHIVVPCSSHEPQQKSQSRAVSAMTGHVSTLGTSPGKMLNPHIPMDPILECVRANGAALLQSTAMMEAHLSQIAEDVQYVRDCGLQKASNEGRFFNAPLSARVTALLKLPKEGSPMKTALVAPGVESVDSSDRASLC